MSGRYQKARLYVGNISSRTSIRDLEHLFGKYGSLCDVTIKDNFGFVEYNHFDDAESAVRRLDQYEIGGKRLRVEFAKVMQGVMSQRGYDRFGAGRHRDHHSSSSSSSRRRRSRSRSRSSSRSSSSSRSRSRSRSRDRKDKKKSRSSRSKSPRRSDKDSSSKDEKKDETQSSSNNNGTNEGQQSNEGSTSAPSTEQE